MEDTLSKEEEKVLDELKKSADKDKKERTENRAEEKDGDKKAKPSPRSAPKKKGTSGKKTPSRRGGANKKSGEKNREIAAEAASIAIICVSLLLIFGLFNGGGIIGQKMGEFMIGIFGFGAYIIPVALIGVCLYMIFSREKTINGRKAVMCLSIFFIVITFLHIIHMDVNRKYESFGLFSKEMFKNAACYNGGLLGAYTGTVLCRGIGRAFSVLFLIMGFTALGVLLTGIPFFGMIKKIWQGFASLFTFEEALPAEDEELIEEGTEKTDNSSPSENSSVKVGVTGIKGRLSSLFKGLKGKNKSDADDKENDEKLRRDIREQIIAERQEQRRRLEEEKAREEERKRMYRELPKPTVININPNGRHKSDKKLEIALDRVVSADKRNMEPARSRRFEADLPRFIKNREKYEYEKFLEKGKVESSQAQEERLPKINGLDAPYTQEAKPVPSEETYAGEYSHTWQTNQGGGAENFENAANIHGGGSADTEPVLDVSGIKESSLEETAGFYDTSYESYDNYTGFEEQDNGGFHNESENNSDYSAENYNYGEYSFEEENNYTCDNPKSCDNQTYEEYTAYSQSDNMDKGSEQSYNGGREENASENYADAPPWEDNSFNENAVDSSYAYNYFDEVSRDGGALPDGSCPVQGALNQADVNANVIGEASPDMGYAYNIDGDENYSDTDYAYENFRNEGQPKALNEASSDEAPFNPNEQPHGYYINQNMVQQRHNDKNGISPSSVEQKEPTVVERPEYVFPKLEFLGTNPTIKDSETGRLELLENSKKLVSTLESFSVKSEVKEISKGPAVTRYELSIAPGIKVSKILGLADNLALSLAATSIRIEAPIPGKSAVGIEIPNSKTTSVYLSEVVGSEKFKSFESKLAFGLGKDIAGNVVVTDIADMPHMLIAGATGSGKSVCINTLITSILYKSSPEDVRLIMVDPKVVELSVYNGIPHLLIPVVTEADKAANALSWAVHEMTERYERLARTGTRNIKGYNKVLEERGEKKLPQIVIIIDELADLMMAASKEVEASICRLAQLARAAGIHLIIATQRPSVDVITGLIKANIPSRIAFAVSSATDSRTIIDSGGAEKLLGKGDMLFKSRNMIKPQRIQGAFVTDGEIEKIVTYLKENNPAEYDEEVITKIETMKSDDGSSGYDDGSGTDELTDEVISFIVRSGKCSTSLVQRKFKIGYNRAARIVEELEDRGIIGPENGSKPREVLMDKYQMEEYFTRNAGY